MNVSSTPVKITFATKLFDALNYFNTTTSRFTPLVAGTYRVSSVYRITASLNATFFIAIYKNGLLVAESLIGNPTSNSLTFSPRVDDLIQMNGSTDYIEVFAYSNSVTPVTITAGAAASYVTINKVWYEN